MKNVTLEDIREHYHKTHFTQNMRFVIAGKITAAASGTLITELLEDMALPRAEARIASAKRKAPKGLKEPLYIR